MLTIRHIAPDGRETVLETRRVITSNGAGEVYYENEDRTVTNCFSDGNVYVMNGNGRTVAIYNIGPMPTVMVPDTQKR